MRKQSHYAVLGIENEGASADEIRAAFRSAAQRTHPDRSGGDETAFKAVNKAYEVLSDPKRREQYDCGADVDNESEGVEHMARDLAMQCIDAVLQTPVGDIVTNAIVLLNGKRAEHVRNKEALATAVAALKQKRAKVTVKGEATNLGHMVIDDKLRGIAGILVKAKEIDLIYERAHNLLRQHDAEEEPVQPVPRVFFSSGTGGPFG